MSARVWRMPGGEEVAVTVRGADVGEFEAIVRDLARFDPLFEVESHSGFRWCCLCGQPGEPQLEHSLDCLYFRAKRAVVQADAGASPRQRHVRWARMLNRGKGGER